MLYYMYVCVCTCVFACVCVCVCVYVCFPPTKRTLLDSCNIMDIFLPFTLRLFSVHFVYPPLLLRPPFTITPFSSSGEGISKKSTSPFTHAHGAKDCTTIPAHRQPQPFFAHAHEDADLSLRVRFPIIITTPEDSPMLSYQPLRTAV